MSTIPLVDPPVVDPYHDIQAICAGVADIHALTTSETYISTTISTSLSSADCFAQLQTRSRAAGYTVWLQAASQPGRLTAVFVKGVPPQSTPQRLIPALLFVATLLSCLACGALYQGIDVFANPAQIWRGWPFAATVLGILAAHEMGHYVVGKWWGAPVSLPYFIPLPPPLSITGTLGAVIVQREPMRDRRVLLDVGLAGPFAGLVVALPLLWYGLTQSTVGPMPATGYIQEGNSALYLLAKLAVFGQILPNGNVDVQLSDVAFAAWIGLLVTMFNLLPIGQLDGGHAAYALFGKRAVYLAYATVGFCVLMGIYVDNTWLIWGIIAVFANPRHPAPYDDVTPIGWWRIIWGLVALITLLFLLTPAPLRVVPGLEGVSG
jgi:membrane-associated protease RseP (regulator of RpoE activity)